MIGVVEASQSGARLTMMYGVLQRLPHGYGEGEVPPSSGVIGELDGGALALAILRSRPRSRQQRRLRGHQFRATLSQRPTTHQQLTHHQPPSLTMVHQFRATPSQTPTTH